MTRRGGAVNIYYVTPVPNLLVAFLIFGIWHVFVLFLPYLETNPQARKKLGFEGLFDATDLDVDDVVGLCSGKFVTQAAATTPLSPATPSATGKRVVFYQGYGFKYRRLIATLW